jgi:hypothetical protein
LRGKAKKAETPSLAASRNNLMEAKKRRFFNGTMAEEVLKALESGERYLHYVGENGPRNGVQRGYKFFIGKTDETFDVGTMDGEMIEMFD